jgi:hypothetical protein
VTLDGSAQVTPTGRRRVVAWQSWLVALPVGVVVAVVFLAAGPTGAHGFYWRGDAPSFLAVARSPFGSGRGFPGNPLQQGVAYRYGRVLLPLAGWLLALGRSTRVPWTLAAVYVASFACWIAVAAEHLRRCGRKPTLAWWILACPFVPLWLFAAPTVVAEPMAGALVLVAYLFDRDGRSGAARVAAAAAILTRETMAVAFLPLVWRAWRKEGRVGLARWMTAGVPYAVWAFWVRVRVGHFPFLDPASNRRDAFALPFVGWWETLQRPFNNGQQYGLLVGALTLAVAVTIAVRAQGYRPLVWAAVTSSALVTCYGWSVWQFPSEAMRVLAPVHVLLLLAAIESFAPRTVPVAAPSSVGDVSCVLDLRESSSTSRACPVDGRVRHARARSGLVS